MAVSALFLLSITQSCSGGKAVASLEQPVKFNHRIHAKDFSIPCLYCHMYADRSPVAGVPSVKACMGCHELVATDKPEVEKLTRYWEEKKQIEWIKIYDLPDYVRFTHKRHVLAGVGCQECHGEVQTMERITRVSDLSMGWCLKCHIKRNADIDCLVCHH